LDSTGTKIPLIDSRPKPYRGSKISFANLLLSKTLATDFCMYMYNRLPTFLPERFPAPEGGNSPASRNVGKMSRNFVLVLVPVLVSSRKYARMRQGLFRWLGSLVTIAVFSNTVLIARYQSALKKK